MYTEVQLMSRTSVYTHYVYTEVQLMSKRPTSESDTELIVSIGAATLSYIRGYEMKECGAWLILSGSGSKLALISKKSSDAMVCVCVILQKRCDL
ncbi:hypothetical protein BaRGS_00024743 [Batillaria attramentaria]|uniref:Uncharacterized protein n=1 Tax=Batillaria attramentaria TaxID=370345 RepID=A0ABD0KA91_9CAEN